MREQLDLLMAETNGLGDPDVRYKPHLYSKWVSDLVRHPAILDAVESVLGPNIFVWRSVFFLKQASSPRFVEWHQDSAYWGLEPYDVATAWIALTDSTRANGCVQVVPGSHHAPVPHGSSTSKDNILVRGQCASVDIPDTEARAIELRAGEMSLHHIQLLHGSRPNTSGRPRIGLAVRYLATHVRQRGMRQGASLVRGTDAYGHFDHEPEPATDRDPVAMRWHRRSRRRHAAEFAWETIRRASPSTVLGTGRLLLQPGRVWPSLRSMWRIR